MSKIARQLALSFNGRQSIYDSIREHY